MHSLILMTPDAMKSTDLPVKDEESERAIPTTWRPTIRQIASAFACHDYQLANGISGVDTVPFDTAEGIRRYIADYGEELTELSEETWNSSVCIWMGSRWDALVDLWTVAEGRSDLVLQLHIYEDGEGGYKFSVYMVYVP
jgi:hypothetical protein